MWQDLHGFLGSQSAVQEPLKISETLSQDLLDQNSFHNIKLFAFFSLLFSYEYTIEISRDYLSCDIETD